MADTIEEQMKQSGATVWESGQKKEEPQQDSGQQAQGEPEGQAQQSQDEPKQEPQQSQQEPQGQSEPSEKFSEEKAADWLSRFNERFQTNFQNEDEVNELFDYKNKYSDLENKVKQKDEALSQASDPTSYFANENLMKINEIVKQHNVDESTASRLISTDFSSMGSEDVLVMQKLMEEPEWRGSEDALREEIQEQYGLDENPDDYEDEAQQAKARQKIERKKKRMEVDARKARDQFSQMQQVELPGKQDLEGSVQQQKEQLAQSAEQNADKFISDMEKINYHEDMEFQVDDEWRNKYLTKDKLKEFAQNYNLDLSSEEGYKQAQDIYKTAFIKENLSKLFNDYKKRLQTQQRDKEFEDYNNPRSNNRQQKPDEGPKPKSREAVNQEIAKDMGIKQ